MAATVLDLNDVRLIGRDLQRPECVLTTPRGDIYTADWRGGVARTGTGGSHELIEGNQDSGEPRLQPNGISLEPDGSFLLADISEARAGIWHLSTEGEVTPFLLEVEGLPLPPVNFVYRDAGGRVWVTVSTRVRPRSLDYRPAASSGFIIVVDALGARTVADGLGYTNECRVDPSGDWLYVNETFGRRLSRFRILSDSSLGDRETVAVFGPGTFPDGLEFDSQGGIWIASIVSNRLIRVDRDGSQELMLEDCDLQHMDWVERAFQEDRMDRRHLDTARSRILRNISSIAFGGPDLKTIYMGCLLGDQVAVIHSPVPGAMPVHWTYSI